jgi:hypothetical protein
MVLFPKSLLEKRRQNHLGATRRTRFANPSPNSTSSVWPDTFSKHTVSFSIQPPNSSSLSIGTALQMPVMEPGRCRRAPLLLVSSRRQSGEASSSILTWGLDIDKKMLMNSVRTGDTR